jgi:hypothetical protein
MGNISLVGATSGGTTLVPQATGTYTVTLPAATGTLAITASPTFTGVTTESTITSPAATALTIQSAGTTAMTVDTSQNVGIGTTTPSSYSGKFVASGASPQIVAAATSGLSGQIKIFSNAATTNDLRIGQGYNTGSDNIAFISNQANADLLFRTNSTEAMRIDSSGNVLVGRSTNSTNNAARIAVSFVQNGQVFTPTSDNKYPCAFENAAGSTVGYITTSSSATTYSTTSDYRLKENVAPMTSGLVTIAVLKPVTYNWTSDKSVGEGFIAHELAEVIPLAVSGEKDAVNEDGSIKPQGVDYSKIVVHLVAAIQELSAKNGALEARLAALEAK